MSEQYYDMEFQPELRSSDLLEMIFSPDATYETLAANVNAAENAIVTCTSSTGFIPVTEAQGSPNNPTSTTVQRPLPTGTHPSVDEFGGQFGFDICREALTKIRSWNSWTYSDLLNQVFIKANSALNIRFKLSKPLDDKQYFVRALLIFQCHDFLSEAVRRCTTHWIEDDPNQLAHKSLPFCACVQYNLAGHVLRCPTPGSIYDFNPLSGRHSVLLTVPTCDDLDKSDELLGHYYFACNTSCPSGMQRRQVQIIFTFEDQDGRVYGRRVLPVKVCHCPKRDKDRMERCMKTAEVSDAYPNKRLQTELPENPTKKIKVEKDVPTEKSEDLEAKLVETFKKQEKDLEAAATLVTGMAQRQREMADLLKQLIRPNSSRF